MDCFFACFRSSGSRKSGNQRKHKVLPGVQKHGSHEPLQPEKLIPVVQEKLEEQQSLSTTTDTVKLIPEVQDKLDEQLSLSTRKKVTFDNNIRAYEPISIFESTELVSERNENGEKKREESLGESLTNSPSGDDSDTSSVQSHPPSYRYQNCRDSDKEEEEFECEVSDLDGVDDGADEEDDGDFNKDEDGEIEGNAVWSESIPAESMESSTGNSSAQLFAGEVNSFLVTSGLATQGSNTVGLKEKAQDRSDYIHPVLNPVENLTQWRVVRSKGTTQLLKPLKENSTVNREVPGEVPHASFSFNPTLEQSTPDLKSKLDQSENQSQDISLDASLSNWLVSSETTPEKSWSQGSNSVISFEDRPILGALTVEELRQFSSSSSPRRSPRRSPDEMPIIGTVGTYWSDTRPAKGSDPASSFKGIPNTTSKYREDKRVNWHTTPFETRLEKTLNRHVAEA